MNRVKDNTAHEYVVEPQPPALLIEGYGLLYEGRPLLVEDESIERGGYKDHYNLCTGSGMPYLVDLHTMRYYLATYHLKGRSYWEPYKPQDCYNLVHKAPPCHITVSMTVGTTFSLTVTTKPLTAPIEPYKVLPSDCLDDTVTGPREGTIIKVLKYVPDGLAPGNEYVNDGFDVSTYIGSASMEEVGHYYRGDEYSYHIFRRENRYPEFYESLDMTSILALHRGMK
jgi:hypothetical protein